MNCRNCRTKMNYQTDGDFFSCVCGINTPAGWRKVSAIATSISIDIPYDPPPKTSPTRTQKIIENKLKERREWLEFRCITEHDIVVEDGGEYFILPDLKGNPVRHEVPGRLTRVLCHSIKGQIHLAAYKRTKH